MKTVMTRGRVILQPLKSRVRHLRAQPPDVMICSLRDPQRSGPIRRDWSFIPSRLLTAPRAGKGPQRRKT
eukprot:2427543-Pyramimonas_sp.AAC.1